MTSNEIAIFMIGFGMGGITKIAWDFVISFKRIAKQRRIGG